jgi:N,N'-diacetyllegionaminate synthase
MSSIVIGTKTIGPGHPCFIIAEGGLNHNGSEDLAIALMEKAAACGADAVKFQTYTPEELFPPDHPDYAKFQKCVFSRAVYQNLQQVADTHNLILLSTPFDEASADLLDALHFPAFKIGSGELTHHSFLAYLAAKRKPMIVSTGMSTQEQVRQAVNVIQRAGNRQLALLHCVSSYPCPVDQAHIKMVKELQQCYPVPVGYSDHTTVDTPAVAAVALGACIVEKHFTLSHHLPGWDHSFSYDPEQFKRFTTSIRETEAALGSAEKRIFEPEEPIRQIARRAIYTRTDLPFGHIVRRDDLVIRRPIGPIPADQIDSVVGKTLRVAVPAKSALKLDFFL